MFRLRDPQRTLFASSHLVPAASAHRLERSWAEVFRAQALPLIDEAPFAPLYCADNGRPNRAVQTVLGVLLLKELYGLTDAEALEQLEFNLLWHHALDLTLEEAHLPQKTLHNFRQRLLASDQGQAAFEATTDRLLAVLGLDVGHQRLDSTQVISNIAVLTRLGLFCETIRVFLAALKAHEPAWYATVPEGVRRRYITDEGEGTAYADARSEQGRRRLSVCARDVYRLCQQLEDSAATALEAFGLLPRLLADQCTVVGSEQPPDDDDDDAGEGGVPVILTGRHNIRSDSMQSPHDPDVTYSGHKGQGFAVQISETCAVDNPTQLITHVDVTDACASDAEATMGVLEALIARGHQPHLLLADTAYGSGANAVEAERVGTELLSPVGGTAPTLASTSTEAPVLTEADFHLDATGQPPARCPSGQVAHTQRPTETNPHRIHLTFHRAPCEACPLYSPCPVRLNRSEDGYEVTVDLVAVNRSRRRAAQASGQFRPRYAPRAGIEATNSELKRAHRLDDLRVRGRLRVRLAVYLKALACNLKRMVRRFMDPVPQQRLAAA